MAVTPTQHRSAAQAAQTRNKLEDDSDINVPYTMQSLQHSLIVLFQMSGRVAGLFNRVVVS